MRLLHTYQIPTHVTALFFPAYLALAMRVPCKALRFDLEKREINFEFEIPDFAGSLDIARIGEELRALSELEKDFPNPSCPCGCGAVVIFTNCLSACPVSEGLTMKETDTLISGNHIMAIKLIRERLGIGLREAKDMADQARARFEADGIMRPRSY